MINADIILPYPVMESPFTLVEAAPPPLWGPGDLPHVNAALSAATADLRGLREERAEVQAQLDTLTRRFAAQSTEIAALDRVVGLLGALMEGGGA